MKQKLKRAVHSVYGCLERRPVLFIVINALILNCIIELFNSRSPWGLLLHIVRRPHVFLYNTLIVLLTLLLTLVVRRRLFAATLASVVWIGFGITNFFLSHSRVMPFSARDFFLIKSALKVASKYFSVLDLILIGAGVLLVIGGLVLLFIKCPKCPPHANLRRVLCFVGVYAVIFTGSTIFAATNVAVAADYDNINDAYDNCGFAFCFASSVLKNGVSRPDAYSDELMDDIVSEIGEGDTRPVMDSGAPNVIFVQLESFFDPARVEGLEFTENPIPNFTALRESCPSGILYVPSLGGGTVNVEFEVLTGMSLDYFALAEYPYESILQEESCESLAYYFSSAGYTAHAIHNNEGTFYYRNTAYGNLGFDTFTSYEYMEGLEYVKTGWCKDAVLTRYILEALDSTESRDFIFTVSVQAHGKYPDDYSDASITLEENAAIDFEDSRAELEYYVEQLHGSDAFVGDLINELSKRDEKYIVVVYGDHLPALGIEPERMDTGTLYSTEYIIWNNYGLKGEDRDLDAFRLGSRVLELADIDGGLMTDFHRYCYGKVDYYSHLQALEYDLLYGEQLAYDGHSPYAPKQLHMGLEEIRIRDISCIEDSGLVYVYGENFTEFSYVYVNGKKRDTAFVDRGTLMLEQPLEAGDSVTVCQAGPDGVVLSATEAYVYN